MTASRTRKVDFSGKRPTSLLCTKIPPTFETPTLGHFAQMISLSTCQGIRYTSGVESQHIQNGRRNMANENKSNENDREDEEEHNLADKANEGEQPSPPFDDPVDEPPLGLPNGEVREMQLTPELLEWA